VVTGEAPDSAGTATVSIVMITAIARIARIVRATLAMTGGAPRVGAVRFIQDTIESSSVVLCALYTPHRRQKSYGLLVLLSAPCAHPRRMGRPIRASAVEPMSRAREADRLNVEARRAATKMTAAAQRKADRLQADASTGDEAFTGERERKPVH